MMSHSPGSHPKDVLEAPAPALSPRDAERIAREHFGVTASARALVSERDQNFHLKTEVGDEFVLKISNPAQDAAVVDFEVKALRHIAEHDPDLPVTRVCMTVDGSPSTIVDGLRGTRHITRLFTHLPGRPLGEPARTPRLRFSLGEINARLGKSLRGFFHPAAGHVLLWDVKQTGRLRDRLSYIEDSKQRQLVERWLDRFERHTLPVIHGLRAQVIHNDMNLDNVLVNDDRPDRITGVIDFGDMVHTILLNDLAVSATDHLAISDDPIGAVGDVIAGYHSVTPLEEEEFAMLFDLIATRLVTMTVISAWRSRLHPENRGYLAEEHHLASRLLRELAGTNRESVESRFRQACGLDGRRSHGIPPGTGTEPPPSVDELIERRTRALGPAYELFYDSPLHLVRGEGVWLYDADGRAYLDVYNNVPHVGHCHPHVSEAITAQSRTLNTNTRYLDQTVLDLAERLTAGMPGGLSVCMFVCTGSEANDLAWRLARAQTGAEGVIVTGHAYHGNTNAVIRMSTEDIPAERRAAHVRSVPAPDLYRGPFRRGDPDAGMHYAACLDAAIDSLRADGFKTAAFLFDSCFASDGVLVAPDGYLRGAFERVRAAGGLCIADEVQAGFGRSGTHMWGFATGGVVPDIVTLGKPMGNGHPIAAVITTPEIAGRLGRSGGYFNTFGGNAVSCAAGLAVLDVIEREALQTNALRVGGYMKDRLIELADRHALIGDVRGAGLFLGVELVRDRATLEPATSEARAVMNGMRRDGVLVGLTGPHGNVLKIRPPMVFTRANADLLAMTLDRVLVDL